jgi:predicted SnoaL-like aldol condensation-catalyzing enzyme
MSTEKNKEIVTRALAVFSSKSVAEFDRAAEETYAPDYILHDPGAPNFGNGPEAVKQFMHAMIENTPDIQIVIQDVLAEDDRVAIRFTGHATNVMTGKQEVTEVMCFSRLSGGKVVEEWELGVPIPLPSSAEDNKKTILLWYETTNTRDLGALDRLIEQIFAPDYVYHDPGFPDFGRGPEAMKWTMHQIIQNYPDLHVAVEDLFAEGNKVSYRVVITGTDATSGESLHLLSMGNSCFADGKIVEEWSLEVPIPTAVKA